MRQMMIRGMALVLVGILAGCAPLPVAVPAPAPSTRPVPVAQPEPVQRLDAETAARNFTAVVARMEPVAERECLARTRNVDCDFLITVDRTPGAPANAFQTLDRNGRPVIGFTLALIAEARNQDELAFILGHEAAHHIAGHIPRTQQSAVTGAMILGTLASLGGASPEAVRDFERAGATIGARSYSREFELEADALGTILAWRAGYDPERGAEFFSRIPDPGNRFLGTHPPNAQRAEVVRRTVAQLR
ncbi:M48 family metallopeptidase [Plastorhodobacter daqingensis]|uniref:M48 family metallopeptidase n=1 Tax=Plastorhodobacter daqingensis TaxID=1387281 RepID=A0ABW2UIJ7_9RHOB